MNATFKISFKESTKAVNAEVTLEGEKGEQTLKEAQELMNKAMEYSKLKTLQKNI